MPDDLIARGLGATDAELGIAPPTPVYTVFLRDSSYALVDRITEWLSLTYITRFNATGTWSAEFARFGEGGLPHPVISLFTKTCGIVIKRDGVTVFSGRVSTEYTLTATTLRVAGVDDLALLEVPALPDVDGPPYDVAYYTDTGVPSTVLRRLVSINIGASARPDRAISALTFGTDPLLGTEITVRANLDPIITLLSGYCLTPAAGGLRFTLLQSDTVAASLEFTIAAPVDRTDDAKFSIELNTAQDFEDTQSMPAANKLYVLLGDGLTGSRTILEDSDAASITEWGWQRELVIDMRGTTDTSEGEQRLAEELAKVVTSRRVALTPFQLGSLVFGVDYDMGDLVQFAVNGVSYPAIIREVTVELTTDRGVVVTPLIGDAGSTGDDRAATQIATLSGRISNIERNWNVPDDSIIQAMMHANSVGTAELIAESVTPAKLASIDTLADNEVPVYDAFSGQFKWYSFAEFAATGSFVNLTVTGNTILGDNAAVDTLAVNAVSTFKGAVTIENSALTVLALFDVTAGAQKARIGDSLAPGLYVDVANLRTLIGTTTPLSGAADDKLSVIGGVSYFAGNSGPSAGFRYSAAETSGWTVGESAAGANADLVWKDDGAAEIIRFGDAASSYQLSVQGNEYVTGVLLVDNAASAARAVLGGTTFSGSEKLRVVGTSRQEGQVVITTGGIDSTGTNLFRSSSTFSSSVQIDFDLDIDRDLDVDRNADIGGTLNVDGAVTMNGNVDIGNAAGDSHIVNGTMAFNHDLNVFGRVNHDHGAASSATITGWDGYVEMKFSGSTKRFYYKD